MTDNEQNTQSKQKQPKSIRKIRLLHNSTNSTEHTYPQPLIYDQFDFEIVLLVSKSISDSVKFKLVIK
jgi:hypothetical protein